MYLEDFLGITLPFDFDLLPENSYLVGGAVRDVLLKRSRDYLDLDFIVPERAIATAKKIASAHHGGFVILDQQRQIARVVFEQATIDIAQQEGNSLITDLQRRDYTINAIAYECTTNRLVDPLQGEQDIEEGLMRMVARKNLIEDPLRLLRGYRQACQLNFTIEAQTQKTIQELASLITQVANERVNAELGYLLSNERGSLWLIRAFADNLLSAFFPHATAEQIALLPKIDEAINWLNNQGNCLSKVENEWLSMARLAYLTSINPAIAQEELSELKYSRQEIKTVTTLLKYTPELSNSDFASNLRKQYFFFLAVGDILPTLVIFALAQNIATELIIMLCDRYCDIEDRVAHPQPILTGNELMQSLGIKPSPLIGELLTEVQVAYIEGKVKHKEQALSWLAEYLKVRETGI